MLGVRHREREREREREEGREKGKCGEREIIYLRGEEHFLKLKVLRKRQLVLLVEVLLR
jgi:hypothetical protein